MKVKKHTSFPALLPAGSAASEWTVKAERGASSLRGRLMGATLRGIPSKRRAFSAFHARKAWVRFSNYVIEL